MAIKFDYILGKLRLADTAEPGGSDTQIQFNDGGAFGGDSAFTFNKTTKAMSVGTINVTPSTTTSNGIFVNAPSGYASAAMLLDLQINGTRKIGVDWQGYLTSPTHVIRFKRNDSSTAYLELKSEGPNGFGAISLSGTDALSRSSTGIDYGDIAGALNTNFRGASMNLFIENSKLNFGNVANLYWNGFGNSFSKALFIGVDDYPANATDMLRVTSNATTKRNLILKKIASQAVDIIAALPSDQTVEAFALDEDYKLQWGDGAGTAVDTNLYRNAANTLKTDDNFVSAGTGSFANGIVPRVVTAADDSTAVIDVGVTDQYQLTAMANATTISTTGTPVAGQKLIIRLKDNGTSRALTWDGVFRAVGVTLPTATTISKTLYIGCVYNLTDTKWDAIAVASEV